MENESYWPEDLELQEPTFAPSIASKRSTAEWSPIPPAPAHKTSRMENEPYWPEDLELQEPTFSPSLKSKPSTVALTADSKPEPPSTSSSTNSQRPPISLLHEVAFVITIMMAQILLQAGVGQGLAPLHIIGDHFDIKNSGELSWYIAGFTLTAGTFILIAGRCGDIYGHKLVFITAFMWYGVWSILCGASYFSNNIFFSIARGFQGMGPAFITPNGLALLGLTYPNGMRKNLVFSLFGACAPGGNILGAMFSALIGERTLWAWAYWVMGIVCFLVGTAALWTVPAQAAWLKEKQLREPQHFDFLGALSGVSGLVLFNVAWNQAPIVGWQDPYVYVLLILGILSLVAFFFVESRVHQPLLPVKALSAPVLFVLSATGLGWGSFGIYLYYLWQFLIELRHLSPLLVAAQNSPSAVTGVIAAVVTGFLISHIPTPYIMILALIAFLITPILTVTMPIHQTYWASTFVSTVIIPFGMDMSFPASTIILSGSVPKEHQGIAASLVLTVTNYSISLGLGIAGTVASHIDPHGNNILGAFRSAWYTSIGLAALGLIIAILSAVYMRRHPLAAPPH